MDPWDSLNTFRWLGAAKTRFDYTTLRRQLRILILLAKHHISRSTWELNSLHRHLTFAFWNGLIRMADPFLGIRARQLVRLFEPCYQFEFHLLPDLILRNFFTHIGALVVAMLWLWLVRNWHMEVRVRLRILSYIHSRTTHWYWEWHTTN